MKKTMQLVSRSDFSNKIGVLQKSQSSPTAKGNVRTPPSPPRDREFVHSTGNSGVTNRRPLTMMRAHRTQGIPEPQSSLAYRTSQTLPRSSSTKRASSS